MSEDSRPTLPYLALGLLTAFLAGVLTLILRSRRYPAQGVNPPPNPAAPARLDERDILLPETLPAVTQPAPDDLTVIEGIGLKVSAVLNAAGIQRLDQLAATPVDELTRILRAAGNRISVPATWPEQARLAAAGRWDELKAYQASLRGGREA